MNTDFDKDGMSNLLEFVLIGDPTVSDLGILPSGKRSVGDYKYTFTRSEDSKLNVDQTVQFGINLSTWTSIPIPDASGTYTIGAATVTIDDGTPATEPDTVTVSIPLTSAPNGKLFTRLFVAE